MQKRVLLDRVNLVRSFPTSIYMQKSVPIQPRTSPPMFGLPACPLLVRRNSHGHVDGADALVVLLDVEGYLLVLHQGVVDSPAEGRHEEDIFSVYGVRLGALDESVLFGLAPDHAYERVRAPGPPFEDSDVTGAQLLRITLRVDGEAHGRALAHRLEQLRARVVDVKVHLEDVRIVFSRKGLPMLQN